MSKLVLGETRSVGFFIVATLAIFLFSNPVLAGTEIQITNNASDQFSPYVTGNRIVWEDWRDGNPEIYMYDISSQSLRRITENSFSQQQPVISGDKIFWTDFRTGNLRRDIFMYDLIADTETRLINAPENQYVWDTSANKIVWMDDRNIFRDIYVYDLDMQTTNRLTTGDANNTIRPHFGRVISLAFRR